MDAINLCYWSAVFCYFFGSFCFVGFRRKRNFWRTASHQYRNSSRTFYWWSATFLVWPRSIYSTRASLWCPMLNRASWTEFAVAPVPIGIIVWQYYTVIHNKNQMLFYDFSSYIIISIPIPDYFIWMTVENDIHFHPTRISSVVMKLWKITWFDVTWFLTICFTCIFLNLIVFFLVVFNGSAHASFYFQVFFTGRPNCAATTGHVYQIWSTVHWRKTIHGLRWMSQATGLYRFASWWNERGNDFFNVDFSDRLLHWIIDCLISWSIKSSLIDSNRKQFDHSSSWLIFCSPLGMIDKSIDWSVHLKV